MNRILSSICPSLLKPGSSKKFLNSLLLHFRPRTVDERTLRFTLAEMELKLRMPFQG
jgi:hypothetical protein